MTDNPLRGAEILAEAQNEKREKVKSRTWICEVELGARPSHNAGDLVVVENPVKPRIISQERLAEIKELQMQSTDIIEVWQNIEEQLEWKIKSARDDLAKGLPVEEGPFEAHLE